jgi:hypothetical protein
MTLHISEAEVRVLLTMPMAVDAVEEISRKQASGEVVVHPRRRFEFPGGNFFHYMAAADYTAGFLAMKQYTYVRGNLRFLVPLYEMATGELLALIEADYMGQLRTGAASGVATKYLARRDARVAAIIGTGGQARTQLEAIATVRKLDSVSVFGRDPQKRESFCREMSQSIGVSVRPASSAAEAVRGAHRVCNDHALNRGLWCRFSKRRSHQRHWLESRTQALTQRRSGSQRRCDCGRFGGAIAAGSRRPDHRISRRRIVLDRSETFPRCGRRQDQRPHQRHRGHSLQVERNRLVGFSGSDEGL